MSAEGATSMIYRTLAVTLVLVFSFCVMGTEAHSAIVQWAGNGHYYEFVDSNVTFYEMLDAVAVREQHMGLNPHPVTITSLAENSFVKSLFPGNRAWLGLTDDPLFGRTEGSFGWVTGEAFVISNWQPAEPNGGTGENYGHYNDLVGGWNDTGPNLLQPYIVEWDEFTFINPTAVPEPQGIVYALLVSLLVVFLVNRRISV